MNEQSTNSWSIEGQIKSHDDGRLLGMLSTRYADGITEYRVAMNIFPYSVRHVNEDTFQEYLKFCEVGIPVQDDSDSVYYPAKHFSEI